MTKIMKTMMELLISLQRAERSTELARRRRHLSPLEQQFAQRHLDLVREIIPSEVLVHYDRMKTTAADLLESPELFSMAVLVATYSGLPPNKRKKFVNHFATPLRPESSGNGHDSKQLAQVRKRVAKPTRRKLTARP